MSGADDWLDAFSAEDFEDPELAELDAAVERVVAAAGLGEAAPRPARRPWVAWVALVVAAAALLAVGARGFAPARAPVAVPEIAPVEAVIEPPRPEAPGAPEAPAPETRAVQGAPGVVVPKGEGTRARAPAPTVEAPPEAEPVDPQLLPGLSMDQAVVRIEGQVAALSSGQLAYLHDASHEPGVRSVRLTDLPVAIRPVGTAFQVVARPQVAVVRVDQGAVEVVHDEGGIVARLTPGQELVLIPDFDLELGVGVIYARGLSLDAVLGLIPEDCLCRPEDVVASLATLRLTPEVGVEPGR